MAATSVFNEQQFENKLVSLKDSQESINSLSAWCLQNRDHHKKIVNCWLHCLKRVKIEQRLSLFYLANDVIQYSKRKHYQFVESWGTALQKATTLVRDDKVKSRIMRIFKIWDERGVYDEAFIADLCGLLTTNIKKKTETSSDSSEFQPSILIGKIRDCKVLEEDTDLRFRKVKENSLMLTDADNMRTSLKDRRHGTDVVAEVDQGVKKMEAYVKALELEIAEREKLIEILHQATLFYESQRGEAKIVSNAYRNFGNKVKSLKRKLDELIPTLSDSPIPSPDANAPSPSPDSDLELPNDKQRAAYQPTRNVPENNGLDFSFMNSTFMGNSQFLDINLQRDVFNDTSHISNNHISDGNVVRPIEVINTREQKKEEDFGASRDPGFNISDFIKSLLPTGVPKPEEGPNLIPNVNQTDSMQPLPPPPMPPIFSTNDTFSSDWKSGWSGGDSGPGGSQWNHDPPQDWSVPPPVAEPWQERPNVLNSDTPESPPIYEKAGAVNQPVEYDDSLPPPPVADVDHRLLSMGRMEDIDHRLGDIDHRLPMRRHDVDQRKLPKMGPKDIDHRNLISLTGSPKKETKPLLPPPPPFVWPGDQDYRSKSGDVDFRISQRPSDFSDPVITTPFNPSQPPPKPVPPPETERKDVNVESIDMDVSEEDEEEPNSLIQLEEDVDERGASFLNQSNLNNFNMSSSFMDNMNSNVPKGQDVDERLKSIFGNNQPPGGKGIPPDCNEDSSRSNEAQVFHEDMPDNRFRGNSENGSDDGERDMNNLEPNGFGNDFQSEPFRREPWLNNEQLDQMQHLFAANRTGPNAGPGPMMRGGEFPPRMRWNSPRGAPRGRGQNRFPFRPRQDMPRGRMPFRPRMQVRGGRW